MRYNIHTSSGVKFIHISTFSFSSKGHALGYEKHAVERVQYMVQYVQIKESLSSHTKITHVLHICCKYKTISSGRIYCTVGLSDTTVLAIYRDILKVSISRYFVINYRDTMPVHYCH